MNDLEIINNGLQNGWNITPIVALVQNEQSAEYFGAVTADIVRNNKKGLKENELPQAIIDFYYFVANNDNFNHFTPDDLLDAFRKQKDKTYTIKRFGIFDTEFAGEVLRAKIRETQLATRDLSNPVGDIANTIISRLKSFDQIEYCKEQIKKIIVRSDPKIKTVDESDAWMVEDILETWKEFYFDITPAEMMKAHRRHHAQGEQGGAKLYGQDYSTQYFGAVMWPFQEKKRKDAIKNGPKITDHQKESDRVRNRKANTIEAIQYLSIFPKFKNEIEIDVLIAFGFVVGTMENLWGRPYPFESDPADVDLAEVLTVETDLEGIPATKILSCKKGFLFMQDISLEKRRQEFIQALKDINKI